MKPIIRPNRPQFSSGPCVKRPGWSPDVLAKAPLGRSHRAPIGKARLARVIDESRRILGIPSDYRLGIVPGSDTGAMEIAIWSLLGSRGVDVACWESFGRDWARDVAQVLELDTRLLEADYGDLPNLGQVDFSRDLLFTWNGTTSGVRVPNANWIEAERQGLVLCDATSAVFAMDLAWDKLDVVTWSWQKVLGGEAAHGMLALSPRAVERLESAEPPRPLPKLFRLTQKGKLTEGIFKGATINTPSMLCVEDALDALAWAERIGGLPELIRRSESNLASIARWADTREWVDLLARDPNTRSCTSICLRITDATFQKLDVEAQRARVGQMVSALDDEGVALDLASYRAAPPGLRVWGGATVENDDIEALLPWLDWAWEQSS